MGFLEGLIQTGQYYQQQDQAGDLADLSNYLELPLPLPTAQMPEERRPQVIRVALKVADPMAVPLDVLGIESISLADYPGPFTEDLQKKMAYLYKSPVGANVTWGFSPIYKLGKGITDGAKTALVGDGEAIKWTDHPKSRFNKMHHRTLQNYETAGFFTKGSLERLMGDFATRVDEIAAYWSDRKRSYLLVLGIIMNGRFAFPGQVPAFVAYFRSKLSDRQDNTAPDFPVDCAVCHKPNIAGRTLDQVFKFSTFDKPGFLPGGARQNTFAVFPVCEDCFALLQRGYTEVESHFTAEVNLPRLNVLIIPEIIGEIGNFERLVYQFQDFLKSGVEKEEGLFTKVSHQNARFVFHFIFTEQNQAQVRLHRMVEDIPPSHFRKLRSLWLINKTVFFPPKPQEGIKHTDQDLDSIIRQIVAMVLSLAEKTEGEKEVMKDRAVNLIADLFSNAYVDVASLKRLVVSRLPGLLADPDWLNVPKRPGSVKLEQWWMLFEFLYAYNDNLDQEEVKVL